jgi:hypothetical protein
MYALFLKHAEENEQAHVSGPVCRFVHVCLLENSSTREANWAVVTPTETGMGSRGIVVQFPTKLRHFPSQSSDIRNGGKAGGLSTET